MIPIFKEAISVFTESLENWVNNTIPPMSHPLSTVWRQPKTSEILLDKEIAMMTQKTFESLAEYSCSQPSGCYEGKMWKREDGAFDQEYLASGGKPVWMLCWYGFCDKPNRNFLATHRRRIIIVG